MNYSNPYIFGMSNNLLRVNGIEGARAFQMQPNSTVALFDSNDDIFYVKNSDSGGFATVKAYRFEAMEDKPVVSEFVTRKEFEELKEIIHNGKQLVPKQSNEPDGNDSTVSVF